MAGAVVVLAVARNCQIAIDRDVVFRLPFERAAMKALPFEPGHPFQIILQALAGNIAQDPVKSSAFHIGGGVQSIPTEQRKRRSSSILPFCQLHVKFWLALYSVATLSRLRTGDFPGVVVTFRLAGADDGIALGCVRDGGRQGQGQRDQARLETEVQGFKESSPTKVETPHPQIPQSVTSLQPAAKFKSRARELSFFRGPSGP